MGEIPTHPIFFSFFFPQNVPICYSDDCFIAEPKKIYSCSFPDTLRKGGGAELEGGSFPKEAEGFLFAPSDVAPWEVEGKDDVHGIGYSGIADQQVLGSRKATTALYGMSGKVGVAISVGVA